MSKKCLWYFIPKDQDIKPFPLFWCGSPPDSELYDEQPECIKAYIRWIFSDQGLDPSNGTIEWWRGLNNLTKL
jgi:hypothetical protein